MARIILVDDEPDILTIVSKWLALQNHTVIQVERSERAMNLITSVEFDLLISDVRMQPVNGMELLKAARENQPKMSVIMITAYHTPETMKEAESKGAYAYLPKPFDAKHLMETITKALAA